MLSTQQQFAYRAGWTRVILAILALTALPMMVPGMARHRPVFLCFLATALLLQVLIKKQIGGAARSAIGGLIDIAVLTFVVHRVGSASTPLASIYVFIPMINALVAGRRIAYALAAVGIVAYTSLMFAELQAWIPYAPDAPDWGVTLAISPQSAIAAALVIAPLLLVSSAVVGRLAAALDRREQELLEANAKLEDMSQRDPLTQLYNRRHLVGRIGSELARVRRGHATALLMLDLDGFKRINDERGHLRGDMLLRQLSNALVDATRETDVAGRYGGDEFLVLLCDTDAGEAGAAATRLVEAVRTVGLAFEPDRPVTASIGVAVARGDDDVAQLIRRADQNTYRAKQRGGDQIVEE